MQVRSYADQEMVATEDATLSALSAEYSAMRDEIGRLIEHEKELVNLSFVVLGAVLALIGTLLGEDEVNADAAFILLFVPLVYLLFALTAAEQTRRILQIARYIFLDLRPRAEALAGGTRLWRWEDWKAGEYHHMHRLGKQRVWILERSRWIALTVPGITALVAYGTMVGYHTTLSITVLAVDVVLIVLQVGVLIYTTEAPGLRHLPGEPESAAEGY